MMSGDAPRRRVKLDDDELDVIEHDVASATMSQVAALVAEVRRLRALLTAPPDDDEWSQFIWDERRNGLRWAMDHFVLRRARKISGDTDE